jgi:AcrR family transcriptional regulator
VASGLKRSDAIANHGRIVEAAAAVFAERGIEATIPQIAARAGVGKATVYRSFPAKADLIAAISLIRLDEIGVRIDQALRRSDPWTAFTHLVEEILLMQAGDRGLGDALRHADRPDVRERRRQILAGIDTVLGRARTAGSARRGVDAKDLRLFISGAAAELDRTCVTELREWQRVARLITRMFAA